MAEADKGASRTALENIRAIAKLEAEAAKHRSFNDRIGDAIGSFAGRLTFVALHLSVFVLWAIVNARVVPGIPAFDPYPFNLLTMIVSMEGVLISTFVLIKQNRMSAMADRRSHLDLQINLLTEKEVTKLIQMLDRISARLGIEAEVADDETRELEKVTAVETLAHELEERLPEET